MLDYYQTAKKASSSISGHPGLEKLSALCKEANKILDFGCGEGTRLNVLLKSKTGYGVDTSSEAIKLAKSQYPQHKFTLIKPDETLPYPDNYFDLVYTTFVLEHTNDPESFINETIRVSNSIVVFLCPNFGAPNRRSPNSIQNPVKKLIMGLFADFLPSNSLSWTKVEPKNKYMQIDDDTTVEPYLHTLLFYLQKKISIQHASSLWRIEEKSLNPRKLIFKCLGLLNIFPFKYWGPQLFVVGKKI